MMHKSNPGSGKKNTPTKLALIVSEKLGEAVSLQNQGRLQEARDIYAEILKIDPNNFNALNLLGVVAVHFNELIPAVDFFSRAIKINPHSSTCYSNRGVALRAMKNFEAAVASLKMAVRIKPDYFEAHSNLGVALQELKQFDRAVASYDMAIKINPKYFEAYYNRGNALLEMKNLAAAVASYDMAIDINPGIAEIYSNRGNALKEQRNYLQALDSYDKALGLKPDFAEAHFNRGVVLQLTGRHATAISCYEMAIDINPAYAEAYSNRGNALHELRQLDAALGSYDKAIALRPDYAEAYSNRANLFKELGHLDAALSNYDMAIAISPEYAEAQSNRSLLLLMQGKFESGWKAYEWRWKNLVNGYVPRQFTVPLWLGEESIEGKIILLHSEQGLGDTIQFSRYVKLVAGLGAKVLLEVPGCLMGLLEGLVGVSELIERGAMLPEFDFHCPLLSLPLAFKTEVDTIPSPQAYLYSDELTNAHWKGVLGTRTKPRVGLVWSGSTTHKNDHRRSMMLAELLDYLPDSFEYFSLQKELRDADQDTIATCSKIRHFGPEIDDFSDTAALCQAMDLVITVDTSVAHLSGALGQQTWILVGYAPDWRWMLDRNNSPWYGSARVYRQNSEMTWTVVLDKIRHDLLKLADSYRSI